MEVKAHREYLPFSISDFYGNIIDHYATQQGFEDAFNDTFEVAFTYPNSAKPFLIYTTKWVVVIESSSFGDRLSSFPRNPDILLPEEWK